MGTTATGISVAEALAWIQGPDDELTTLLSAADRVRREHRGEAVELCAICNARSGNCSEDCGFCPQSVHATSDIERYGLVSTEEMVAAARQAAAHGVARFSIVTSGRAVHREADVDVIARAVELIAGELGMGVCASLGHVSPAVLRRLRDAGLQRYHSNLETAASHWAEVCTTRRYTDTWDTLLAARDAGLSLCSCGIFGMGEAPEQRVELLAKLRELDVDSVPVNFLHPLPGTRMAALPGLSPRECLRVVAVARLMLPGKVIRVCGGREHALRDLQSWLLLAGIDGLMVGNYLTTRGRGIEDDLQMLHDAGRSLVPPPSWEPPA